jgi:hypothetical protein
MSVLQGYQRDQIYYMKLYIVFFSLVDNYTATNNPAIFNDFDLFQKFVEHTYPGSKDHQHDEMANTYVNAVALVLQEYNKSADPNGIVPFQVYTDLAWEDYKKPLSLKKTPHW